jgi:putative transposase
VKRHTAEESIPKLLRAAADLAQGLSIAQVRQRPVISEQTLHRCRNHYGGLMADEANRLKELEAENSRLKRLVAEFALDMQMLQEFVQKSGDRRPHLGTCESISARLKKILRSSGLAPSELLSRKLRRRNRPIPSLC